MMIAYTLQSSNPIKHPDMPELAPFLVSEIEDSRQLEFEQLGYIVSTQEEFDLYVVSIDMTAYNTAMSPTLEDIIDSSVLRAKSEGYKLVQKFARENVLMGITAVTTVAVTKKCHWMEHFLLGGSFKAAVIEIDSLIVSDLTGLSPFVTTTRLTEYKHLVQTYLGVPLT
jgi:hypothetical protein